MKILVMGAGVIEVTTAYQLLQDGHRAVAWHCLPLAG